MLVDASPRVGPIIVDLATQEMAPDAPHMLVFAGRLEMLVTHEDVVDIDDFEGQVVEPDPLVGDAEKHMVVDVLVAAVEAIEGADEVVLAAGIDIVRRDEAERLTEPLHRLAHLGRAEDDVPDAHDRRGPWRDPHGLADARKPLVADIEGLPSDGNAIDGFDAVHELDLVAVRLAEPHPPPGSSIVSMPEAPGSRAARCKSSSLPTAKAKPTSDAPSPFSTISMWWDA